MEEVEKEDKRDREEMIERKCRGGKGEEPGSGEENWCEGGQRERETHRAREAKQAGGSLTLSPSLTHTLSHTHSNQLCCCQSWNVSTAVRSHILCR